MHDEKQQLERRFYRWLKSRNGQHIKAEDFHQHCSGYQPAEGWQRAMSSLIASARGRGMIQGKALTRDRFGSWKCLWSARAT